LSVNSRQLAVENKQRPGGVTAIAVLFFVAMGTSGVTAVLTYFGVWPLAWGRYVVGDLVTLGPTVFAIAALVYAGIAVGLLRRQNWARRVAIIVAAVGLYFLIGPISSAVADLRFLAIASIGAQIIVRVVVLWYLLQERVAEAFG